MIAKQDVSFEYVDDKLSQFRVHLVITLEVNRERDAHLTTQLLYEPELPVDIQSTFHQSLYDAVNNGLSMSPTFAQPDNGITVKIIKLEAEPLTIANLADIRLILEEQTMTAVNALWTAFNRINQGKIV